MIWIVEVALAENRTLFGDPVSTVGSTVEAQLFDLWRVVSAGHALLLKRQRDADYQVVQHKVFPPAQGVLRTDDARATLEVDGGLFALLGPDLKVVCIHPASQPVGCLVEGDLGVRVVAGQVVCGGEAGQTTAEDGNVLGQLRL